MKRSRFYGFCLPLSLWLVACAPHHDTTASLKQQVPAATIATGLAAGQWPKNTWWEEFHDPQLTALIVKAQADAPDMQIARQRIALPKPRPKWRWPQKGRTLIFLPMSNGKKCQQRG